jgi:hypothetical protein
MITILMKKDTQYSFDGIIPVMLLAGETYDVSQECWDCFYAQGDVAEKINLDGDAPAATKPATVEAEAPVEADVVEAKVIETAIEDKAIKGKKGA